MNLKKKHLLAAFVLLIVVSGCRKPEEDKPYAATDTALEPKLPGGHIDYPISGNDNLASLGRVLFYERELSSNRNISCGSCHQQAKAFADGNQYSQGTAQGFTKRNSPSIFARSGKFFWDGRATGLEDMMLRPVRNDVEMGIDDVGKLVARISTIDYYQKLFKQAYPQSERIDSHMVRSALVEFVRNFQFSNNTFHGAEKGTVALSPQEELGRNVFFGKAGCNNCHNVSSTAILSGYYTSLEQSHNIGLDIDNPDKGVGAITGNSSDDGAFMTPVIMNVELTAPYMHDGRFATLEEVVEHYDSGVKNNPNLDPFLRDYSGPKQLHLSDAEKSGLVAFLKALTDRSILTDERFSDPFVARVR